MRWRQASMIRACRWHSRSPVYLICPSSGSSSQMMRAWPTHEAHWGVSCADAGLLAERLNALGVALPRVGAGALARGPAHAQAERVVVAEALRRALILRCVAHEKASHAILDKLWQRAFTHSDDRLRGSHRVERRQTKFLGVGGEGEEARARIHRRQRRAEQRAAEMSARRGEWRQTLQISGGACADHLQRERRRGVPLQESRDAFLWRQPTDVERVGACARRQREKRLIRSQ